MRSPSASVLVGCRSVLKTGAWLVSVTVQVKVSVSVSVPSLTVTSDGVAAGAGGAEGAADDARAGVDADAVRQAGGAVGQRVAVGIGGVGVEADALMRSPSASVLVGQVGAEDRRLVGVGHRPGEGVGVGVGAVGDGDRRRVWLPALAELRVPLMTPVRGIDADAGRQAGGAVGQRCRGRDRWRRRRGSADEVALGVGAGRQVGAEGRRLVGVG